LITIPFRCHAAYELYSTEGSDRVAAETNLATEIVDYASAYGLLRLFSLKHEFSSAFHQLLNPVAGATKNGILSWQKSFSLFV
jgi:hypothetical protein